MYGSHAFPLVNLNTAAIKYSAARRKLFSNKLVSGRGVDLVTREGFDKVTSEGFDLVTEMGYDLVTK